MATSSAAYARYALKKDAADEQRELEKAAKKKGLWGSVGSALGGLGAMALTGGMVNPLTVGLISGAASAAGGFAGSELLTSKKNKDLLKAEGGKFHKGARGEMSEAITGDIIKGAATTALTAGASTFGKEAIKATKDAGTIAGPSLGGNIAAKPTGFLANKPGGIGLSAGGGSQALNPTSTGGVGVSAHGSSFVTPSALGGTPNITAPNLTSATTPKGSFFDFDWLKDIDFNLSPNK